MSDLNDWGDVLPANLRRVWPYVAECASRVGGVLMGGTAVAIHLRHRVSEDLDVMTLRKFFGRVLEKRLRKIATRVDTIEVSDNMFHGYVDEVNVDIFRALPSDSVDASSMRWIAKGPTISGMTIGSIPDLIATKLDVIRFRPKLRDYLDLAALDQSGICSLESGLSYYCQRFGYDYPPIALERVIGLLDNPGTLPTDPEFEDRRDNALSHLKSRAGELRERLADLRDSALSNSVAGSAQRTRHKNASGKGSSRHGQNAPRCGHIGRRSNKPCIRRPHSSGAHRYQ